MDANNEPEVRAIEFVLRQAEVLSNSWNQWEQEQ